MADQDFQLLPGQLGHQNRVPEAQTQAPQPIPRNSRFMQMSIQMKSYKIHLQSGIDVIVSREVVRIEVLANGVFKTLDFVRMNAEK